LLKLRDPLCSTDSFRHFLKTCLFLEYLYIQHIRGIAHYVLRKFVICLLTMLALLVLQKCQEACDEFQTHRDDTSDVLRDSSEAEINPMWFRPVVDKLKDVTERYQNLLSSCSSVLEHEQAAYQIDAKFAELATALQNWLEAESSAFSELKSDESSGVERQLEMVRAFIANAVLNGEQQYDSVKRTSLDLCSCLKELGASEKAVDEVTDRVVSLRSQLTELINAAGDLTNQLEIEKMKSVGNRESLHQLLEWIRDVEERLASFPPVSLYEDAVRTQLHQLHVIQLDIDSHSSTVHLTTLSTRELMKGLTDATEAEELGDELDEMMTGYGRLQDRCSRRTTELEDVSAKLVEFRTVLLQYDGWISATLVTLQSTSLSSLSTTAFRDKLREISNEAKEELADLVLLRRLARDLCDGTRDGGHLTATVAEADRKWEEFCDALGECENEATNREKQLEQFEALKAVVTEWLQTMQAKVNSLEPVALNLTTNQRQMALLEASNCILSAVLVLYCVHIVQRILFSSLHIFQVHNVR